MRTLIALVLLAASLGSPVFAADKPLGPEEFRSVDELAMEIASYFPKVQGEVKAVQADRLTIALGKKEGLMPGMSLTLWRDGKEILHPVSGIVLGREEEEIGTVEVTAVGDGSSTAVVRKKQKDPKPGDRARITPRKISLAIIPLRTDRPELVKQLADQLAASGRFSVLESDKTAAFVKERKFNGQFDDQKHGQRFERRCGRGARPLSHRGQADGDGADILYRRGPAARYHRGAA